MKVFSNRNVLNIVFNGINCRGLNKLTKTIVPKKSCKHNSSNSRLTGTNGVSKTDKSSETDKEFLANNRQIESDFPNFPPYITNTLKRIWQGISESAERVAAAMKAA